MTTESARNKVSSLSFFRLSEAKTDFGFARVGSFESKEFGFETPVGGSGTAKDVGSVALSLVVNRFVNGECILVDGGTLLKHPSKY